LRFTRARPLCSLRIVRRGRLRHGLISSLGLVRRGRLLRGLVVACGLRLLPSTGRAFVRSLGLLLGVVFREALAQLGDAFAQSLERTVVE
jgi:hypothetical protein